MRTGSKFLPIHIQWFLQMLVNGFTSASFTSPGIHQIWKQTFQQLPENFWPPISRKLWKSQEESYPCNGYGPLCKFWRVELGLTAVTNYLLPTKYQMLLSTLHMSCHICLTMIFLKKCNYPHFKWELLSLVNVFQGHTTRKWQS